jgi:PAS domain-containing protein
MTVYMAIATTSLVWLLPLVLLMHRGRKDKAFRQEAALDTAANVATLLFKDKFLIDASRSMIRALGVDGGKPVTWDDLYIRFVWRFPEFPPTPPEQGMELVTPSDQDSARLRVSVDHGTILLELIDSAVLAAERHIALYNRQALEPLGAVAKVTPSPVWRIDGEGAVVWANKAYYALCTHLGRTGDAALIQEATDLPCREEEQAMKLEFEKDGRKEILWYSIICTEYDDQRIFVATDITALTKAEKAQRNFVQTLAKTFAHLPIGLAIFDRNHQLILFNPALLDLTLLTADFLTGRPDLVSVFDRLRESRMMPEPKDYTDWRNQLAELVKLASADNYCETWSLQSGLTFKITGRPHPDGAIAFLIEDISSEMSLTRRFRAELDQSQSALDALIDGIAIFSQVGVLMMCNDTFSQIWDSDPDDSLQELTVLDLLRKWHLHSLPNPHFSDLRDFILQPNERSEWSADFVHRQIGPMAFHVTPMRGGTTMVRFEQILPEDLPADHRVLRLDHDQLQ